MGIDLVIPMITLDTRNLCQRDFPKVEGLLALEISVMPTPQISINLSKT